MSTQTSLPSSEAIADSAEWRDEVAERLKAHRARRRHVAAASLALNFDADPEANAPDPREELKRVRAERRDAARHAGSYGGSPLTANLAEELVANVDANEVAGDNNESVANAVPEPAPTQTPQQAATSNIIEFPRLATVQDVQAESPTIAPPVEDETGFFETQLRIFDADLSEPPLGYTRWAGLRLDEDRPAEFKSIVAPEFELPLQVAPLAKRLSCHVADGMLILGSSSAFALGVLLTAGELPQGKNLLAVAAIVPLLLWTVYQCLFLTLGTATFGMNHAGLGLCNFQDAYATRRQRIGRAFAGILSLLSLGMGYAWVLVDEDALGWHDRMTRTYLRELANPADHRHD